jgi:DNA-binding NarL/FixJ family response regulator
MTFRTTHPADRGVVVVAVEPLLRSGVAAAVAGIVAVRGLGGTLSEAEQLLARHRPAITVLVLDPPLPDATLDVSCGTLIRDAFNTAALVLFRDPQPVAVQTVCRYGARGVWDTSLSPEELQDVLRKVAAGDVVVQPTLVRHLVEGRKTSARSGRGAAARESVLNEREITILQLLSHGHTSQQIGEVLATSAKAVDAAIVRATRRLGAHHRVQALAEAIRRGLVT